MSIRCIYKEHFKDKSEFKLEHILPRDIGGALCSDLFKTHRVCERCNQLSGLFIDGEFLKSWFTKNNQSMNAYKYVDYSNGSVMPLTYCGIFDAESNDQQVCEMWIGPTGDPIYHYHKRFNERYLSYAGGDPIELRKYPGDAYLFLSTNDPGWIKTVLFSFKEHFKKARRFTADIKMGDLDNFNHFFSHAGPEQENVIKRLFTYGGKEFKFNTKIRRGFEQRFLFKLAIGLGYNLLGDAYLDSNYCRKLRYGLWEQDYKSRCNLGLHCAGIFNSDKTFAEVENWKICNQYKQCGYAVSDKTISKIISWEGGNTVILKQEDDFLKCFLIIGNLSLSVCISDEPLLWRYRDLSLSENGSVFIIIPQRSLFWGPVDLKNYIDHKLGLVKVPELTEIEKKRVSLDRLPPFRSENYK